MKRVILKSFSTCLIMGYCVILQAQEVTLSRTFKESTIGELSTRMNDFHVEPDLALKASEHLKKRLAAGHFKDLSDVEAFAESLTTEVQLISKDKHMLIRPVTQTQGLAKSTNDPELTLFEENLEKARDQIGEK